MQYREAAAKSLGSLPFFLGAVLLLVVVCTGLFALPAAAQVSPLAGTPAQGTNPDNPAGNPDLITIPAESCRVSEGASVTLKDDEGETQARFVDGSRGIEITATDNQIRIQGPNDEYIGNFATFPDPDDDDFSTSGNYTVVTTTGIACEEQDGDASAGGGETTGTATATTQDTATGTTTAADDQYDATTGDTTTKAKDGIISDKKIIDIPKQKGIPSEKKIIDVPKQKVLIETGGPPLLLLGAALMCLAGAGIAGQVLRVLRR